MWVGAVRNMGCVCEHTCLFSPFPCHGDYRERNSKAKGFFFFSLFHFISNHFFTHGAQYLKHTSLVFVHSSYGTTSET